MEILQAFKFQLKPKPKQTVKMRQFAGCCRFVWNKALALEKETYAADGKRPGYNKLAELLVVWKKETDTSFLKAAHSQILQQSLIDLDRAYINFFEKRADFPRFKRKWVHDSFRYPQGFKVDEGNSRIYLPKIGWVKYYKSRNIEGIPKQVTVSLHCGHWYVSIQTEREVSIPVHPSHSSVGMDMGIAHFAALSDGTFIESVNAFKKYADKLAKLQRILSRRVKFSSNWRKIKIKIQRLHKKIADVRNDFLHKASTTISKNHAVVVVEDLQVKNMSASASGTLDNPGRNVSAKSGLNRSIRDQGWGEFVRQLGYKLFWLGGQLIKVNPQYTSQKCSRCGYIDKENRKTQSKFKCMACGFEAHADYNAAMNILSVGVSKGVYPFVAAGHAVSACPRKGEAASLGKQSL